MNLSLKGLLFFTIILCSHLFPGEKEITEKISNVLPDGVKIQGIKSSQIKDVYIVDIGDLQPIYVTQDGNFFFYGDLYQVGANNISNLTTLHENSKRQKLLNEEILEGEFISFTSNNPKHEITVFTDVDCQYCRKFHQEIKSYNDLGISVNYVAFPRNGLDSESYNKIVGAWCSKNPKEVLTLQKEGKTPEVSECADNPVSKHYFLGRKIGITGTPAIIRSDGALIPGYVPPSELLERLDNG